MVRVVRWSWSSSPILEVHVVPTVVPVALDLVLLLRRAHDPLLPRCARRNNRHGSVPRSSLAVMGLEGESGRGATHWSSSLACSPQPSFLPSSSPPCRLRPSVAARQQTSLRPRRRAPGLRDRRSCATRGSGQARQRQRKRLAWPRMCRGGTGERGERRTASNSLSSDSGLLGTLLDRA